VADGHGVVIRLYVFSFPFLDCKIVNGQETLLQADSHGVDDLLERSILTYCLSYSEHKRASIAVSVPDGVYYWRHTYLSDECSNSNTNSIAD
jgi:hypothetical protein